VALILQICTTVWETLLLKPLLLLLITSVVPPAYEPVDTELNVVVKSEIKVLVLELGLLKRAVLSMSTFPLYVTVLRIYVNVPTGFKPEAIGKLVNVITSVADVVVVVKVIGNVVPMAACPLKLNEFIVRD